MRQKSFDIQIVLYTYNKFQHRVKKQKTESSLTIRGTGVRYFPLRLRGYKSTFLFLLLFQMNSQHYGQLFITFHRTCLYNDNRTSALSTSLELYNCSPAISLFTIIPIGPPGRCSARASSLRLNAPAACVFM